MSNDIFYGDGGISTPWWRRLSRHTIFVIIALVFVIFGAAIFFKVKAVLDNRSAEQAAFTKTLNSANDIFKSGQSQEAYDTLRASLDKARTKDEKVRLYSDISVVAANLNRLNEALDYLAKKHALAPETAKEDAYVAASYYELLKMNDKAIAQYKIALAYEETKQGMSYYPERIEYIKQTIQKLESER